jgi:hypothetical protein
MLAEQYTTKCYICQKEYKTFSGMDNWSIQDHACILSLCKDCSKQMKDWVEFMKEIHTKKFKCAKCKTLMHKIDEHNWTCKKCGIGLSVG